LYLRGGVRAGGRARRSSLTLHATATSSSRSSHHRPARRPLSIRSRRRRRRGHIRGGGRVIQASGIIAAAAAAAAAIVVRSRRSWPPSPSCARRVCYRSVRRALAASHHCCGARRTPVPPVLTAYVPSTRCCTVSGHPRALATVLHQRRGVRRVRRAASGLGNTGATAGRAEQDDAAVRWCDLLVCVGAGAGAREVGGVRTTPRARAYLTRTGRTCCKHGAHRYVAVRVRRRQWYTDCRTGRQRG